MISSPVEWKGLIYVACSDFILALAKETGKPVWKFDVDGGVASDLGLESPIVSGNTLYIACKEGRICALNASTGDISWAQKTSGEPRSPVVVKDRLYAAVADSHLYCLESDTGKIFWKSDTRSKVYGSPTPYGDLLLLGTKNGLLACNQYNGIINWRSDPKMGAIIGSPAVNDGIVYALNSNGLLFTVRVEDGSSIWEWPALRLGGIAAASPVVGNGGIVYAITHEPIYKGLWLHAIDPSAPYSQAELWDFKSQDFESDLVLWNLSPAADKNFVFMGSLSTYLYAIDASSGKKAWQFETRARVASTPCVASDCVYITDQSGTVYALMSSHPH